MAEPPAYDDERNRTDESLLFYAVKNAGRDAPGRRVRWAHVAAVFGLGSTSAIALCKRLDLEPYEEIGGCTECRMSQAAVCECNAVELGFTGFDP